METRFAAARGGMDAQGGVGLLLEESSHILLLPLAHARMAEAPHGGPHLQTQEHPPELCARTVTPPWCALTSWPSMPRERMGSSHTRSTFASGQRKAEP